MAQRRYSTGMVCPRSPPIKPSDPPIWPVEITLPDAEKDERIRRFYSDEKVAYGRREEKRLSKSSGCDFNLGEAEDEKSEDFAKNFKKDILSKSNEILAQDELAPSPLLQSAFRRVSCVSTMDEADLLITSADV